jgi:hypothetical protein
MRRILSVNLLLTLTFLAVAQSPKKQEVYVPDKKTAELIAEAVLVARYGKPFVKEHLPLLVDGSNSKYWIVQVSDKAPADGMGGGPAVWINKNSGRLKILEYSLVYQARNQRRL